MTTPAPLAFVRAAARRARDLHDSDLWRHLGTRDHTDRDPSDRGPGDGEPAGTARSAARRATASDASVRPRTATRSWLRHGVAALAISVLGLGVAGSFAASTQAEVTGNHGVAGSSAATAETAGRTAAGTVLSGGLGSVALPTDGDPGAGTESDAADVFATTDEDQARSDQVETAIVKERAAQRAEALAKGAETVARTASSEAAQARRDDLSAAELETRKKDAALAWEREQRAIAARVAAEKARASAQTTQTGQPTSTAQIDLSDIPAGSGGVSPVPGAVIGSHFGQVGIWARYHTGLDFRAGNGVPIRSVVAGVVVYAGNSGNWAGNHVAVRHADGYTTMSSHMSSMAVKVGDRVAAGQVIGFVGQTGRAFGAHLHFEVYPPGVRYGDIYKAVNPVPWLKKYGVVAR